ncbi:hypothetical protein ACET66_19785 [Aeromonas simiae]|uniref:hypothetical protein n=1 Tax=Aeromonas simiae TaxID=218936 RepID=UPI0038D1FF38
MYLLTVFAKSDDGRFTHGGGLFQNSARVTLAQTASELVNRFTSGSVLYVDNSYDCYSLGVGKELNYAIQWNGNPSYAGNECFKPVPENNYCAPETGELDAYNFGITHPDELKGLKGYRTLHIYCSDEMKYYIRLLGGGDRVNLDNGMKAKVTVNDRPLTTTVLDGKPGSQSGQDHERFLTEHSTF